MSFHLRAVGAGIRGLGLPIGEELLDYEYGDDTTTYLEEYVGVMERFNLERCLSFVQL